MNTERYQTKEEILDLYNLPLLELIYKAATVHRENHNPNEVQLSSLISIKTGGCPEDCSYCPQSAKYNTHLEVKPMMQVDEVTKDELKEVFKFLKGHEFWSANIQSTEKLRKQFNFW